MKKKILIVDDDPRNIFALSLTLKARGFLLTSTTSAQDALDLLESNADFDLILMDMMMPEMDGYQATKIIKSKDHFKHIPVIAVTAQAMAEDKQKCIDAGATDYISKPINVDLLMQSIEKILPC